MSNFGPGLIGLPCCDNLRSSDILPSLFALQKPAGTLIYKSTGLGTAVPLNEIGRVFIGTKHLEWLFLTNDDNLCPPNAILKLLERDVDVVSGLYLSKMQPFKPIVFDTVTNDGYLGKFLKNGDKGLIPIVACGDGCLLIRRKVLETIPEPWWNYTDGLDLCNHDMNFCKKVLKAGFGLFCDLEVCVGHATSMVVRPERDRKGAWQVHLCQGTSRRIILNV